MHAFSPREQKFCPDHGIARQFAIMIWKERGAARGFQAQVVAKPFCAERIQQIFLATEIFRGGCFGLFGFAQKQAGAIL
jgi:hypothetical protein